ncbi:MULTISPECIES: hypothetical protein [Bordetella]|nr:MULTISPECIES: hypothetical protein [Bordetella]
MALSDTGEKTSGIERAIAKPPAKQSAHIVHNGFDAPARIAAPPSHG